jgi:RNA polymerase sigma factor (sigma-70 family)
MDERQTDNEPLQRWWRQSIENDTASFGKLHAALFDGLYNYANKLLGSTALAEDAVQDLFIKIWNKRNTIGVIQKPKPFFYTALRRQILNQLRDLKVKQLKITLASEPEIEFSQEEIVIKKEEDADLKFQILHLLNSLPNRQREVIYLFYFENLSLSQIAGIMEINSQSAMNLKQRAIQKMRSENLLSFFLLLFSAHHCVKF